MNTRSDFEPRQRPHAADASPLQAVMATSLAQEAHDVVRHLARVLDVKAGDRVLLIPGDGVLAALTLINDYGCNVSVLASAGDEPAIKPTDERIELNTGSLDALPFASETFDAVIVTVPLTSGVQSIARELARVLKRCGRLGVVALSPYRDQIGDDARGIMQQFHGTGQIRPAAAYRAVLAEAGFTAFLSEDRRREFRRSAEAIYREHMLENTAPNTATLGVLAAGGVSMTLLTAEKGL